MLGRPSEVGLLCNCDERSYLTDVEFHAHTMGDNHRLWEARDALLDVLGTSWSRGGMEAIIDVAAGVPFLALPPPEGATADAEVVVVWHMADAPRSEVAMASAIPLASVPAWRVYLGLPLAGSRLPNGSLDAFFELGYQDAVLNLFEPMTERAVSEFPAALAALRSRLTLGRGPLALVGASAGALVALSVLVDADMDLDVRAVALVSPAVELAAVVGANERRFGVTYTWSDASRQAAGRLDFLARADEVKRSGADLLLVVGALDDDAGIRQPAASLCQRIGAASPDGAAGPARATLVEIPGMAHALSEEPGLDPAPQTPHAALVDEAVTRWLTSRFAG